MSTLPAVWGLYAATLPPIIYALFGTSRQLSVGPAALVSGAVGCVCASSINVVGNSITHLRNCN